MIWQDFHEDMIIVMEVGVSHVRFQGKSISSEETHSARRLRWGRAWRVPGTELEQDVQGESEEIKAE